VVGCGCFDLFNSNFHEKTLHSAHTRSVSACELIRVIHHGALVSGRDALSPEAWGKLPRRLRRVPQTRPYSFLLSHYSHQDCLKTTAVEITEYFGIESNRDTRTARWLVTRSQYLVTRLKMKHSLFSKLLRKGSHQSHLEMTSGIS
jgi:hypothetical protein